MGQSGGHELDEFHGQLYSAGAIISGLLIADSSGIITTDSDGISLLGPTVLVAFLAYFGTLLIGRFMQVYSDHIGKMYEKVVSKFGCVSPVSGDFNNYHIGWILGVIFVFLLLIESFVGVRIIGGFYAFIIAVAALVELAKDEPPEATQFFGSIFIVSGSSAISTYVLILLTPYLIEIHAVFGPAISALISVFVILIALLCLAHYRDSSPIVHIVLGLSFPIVVTALAVFLFLIS